MTVLLLVATARDTVFAASAQSPDSAEQSNAMEQSAGAIPAEERRLGTGVFRAALEKRGLTELLALHLLDYPPSDAVSRVLMGRDVKLAEFADRARSTEQRLHSVGEANLLLETLIESHPEDARRKEWLFTLAHSLIYDEAQPLITSVLYRGGSRSERARLRKLTDRALQSLAALVDAVEREYARIDAMSAQEFERLERDGAVENLDRLGPKVEYLRLWALFYDGLGREDAEPTRVGRLREVVAGLTANPSLIKTPHEQSRVQVQSLLLAGMTLRRLNDHIAARGYLDNVIEAADRLGDTDERRRIHWAVTLAHMERIRNDRDDERFDQALRGISRLRDAVSPNDPDPFAVRMVAALLERSVYQAHSVADERTGQPRRAAKHRRQAWQALARLTQEEPERRDELYAVLYDVIGPTADVAQLDPFERCSMIAGLLYDAQQNEAKADALLHRAIELGTRFVAELIDGAPSLAAEVRYNMAVAHYRLDDREQAVRTFLEVARDHPGAGSALSAASFAVQLASAMYESVSAERDSARQLYADALETMVSNFASSDQGRYWLFFHARLLDERGMFDAAAEQYARVDVKHEHYLESAFLRLRAAALSVQRVAREAEVDVTALRPRASDVFTLQREFLALATRRLGDPATDGGNVAELIARSRLLAAETQVALGDTDRSRLALDTLMEFDQEFMSNPSLAARVWRVRLVALERLGKLEEAARAIPEYLSADPVGAGATIEQLYRSVAEEAQRLRREGEAAAARAKAEVALTLAQRIHEWAMRAGSPLDAVRRRRVTVQLAEAQLSAERFKEANLLFERIAQSNPPGAAFADRRVPPDALDRRVLMGRAEALYGVGDFENALPIFNRFAVGLPPADDVRWRALLRDLQCRSELGHPPEDVLKVLDQQRQLYPDMGGSVLADDFDRLYRENQRRRDGG